MERKKDSLGIEWNLDKIKNWDFEKFCNVVATFDKYQHLTIEGKAEVYEELTGKKGLDSLSKLKHLTIEDVKSSMNIFSEPELAWLANKHKTRGINKLAFKKLEEIKL